MFRFTIRDVLWLTVVVAIGLGWWVDRWWLAMRHAEAMKLLAAETKRLVEEQHPGTTIQIRIDGGGISTDTNDP